MKMLAKIDGFLKKSGMSPTRFGRVTMGDPRLVRDLRKGRRPRARTIAKLEAFLAARGGQ